MWQLFHPFSFYVVESLFKPPYYDLIDSLNLSIPLWIGRSGIPVLYSQIATVSSEGFTIKLKSIFLDEGVWDSKSCDNVFPDKSFGIHIPDIYQWFSFNPLGEVVCVDNEYLLFPATLGKGPTISNPH